MFSRLVIPRHLHLVTQRLIKKSKLPPRPKFTESMENEVEEKFMHGGRGPGGQKINKCNSKVQLKHLPTGIVVECQETRSRDQNRTIARQKLALKLAQWQNGGEPIEREVAIQQWEKQSKRSKGRRSKIKHEHHKELKKQQELQALREEEEFIRRIV